MRCVIWCAVSSKPQLRGDSLVQQEKDARAVAERFGWEVVEVLAIPGESRSFIFFQDAEAEIEAYRRFHEVCERRSADVIVCRGRDRLGRTDALIAQIEALAREAGIQIYSMAMPSHIVEPGQATSDRGSLYTAAIERASAQAEIIELRRRHTAGMYARIKRGLMASNPPFGYRRVGKDVPPVQIPEEISILRKVYALYMEGKGCPQIAGWLNRQNVPTQRGGQWRDQTIKYVLANVFYAGWVSYGNLVEPGQHEPLWTAEEWATLKAERRRRQRTRGKSASVFSGLVRCAICEHNMSVCSVAHSLANGEARRYRYFRCVEGHNRKAEHREDPHLTQVSVRRIRAAFLGTVERLRDPAEMKTELTRALAAEKHQTRLEQKAELEAALEESGAAVKKLLDAYTRWGRVSPETFDEAMAEAADHQGELENALAIVLADLEAMPDAETRAQRWRELAYGDLETVLDDTDVKRANAWLARYVKAIWCTGNQVERVEFI